MNRTDQNCSRFELFAAITTIATGRTPLPRERSNDRKRLSPAVRITSRQPDKTHHEGTKTIEKFGDLGIELHETEERLLTELRTLRRGLRETREGSAGPQLGLTALLSKAKIDPGPPRSLNEK
jgi:hypothetical protein